MQAVVAIEAGELIRKASGVVAAKLSYDDFVNLAKGVDVLTNKEIFKVNWETLIITCFMQTCRPA